MKRFLDFVSEQPDAWVRLVESSWRARRTITLRFEVATGQRGRVVACWNVRAEGVQEYSVSDVNGGGLQFSAKAHPAVRQYADKVFVLRFRGVVENPAAAVGELWVKHVQLVDDWIPVERYLPNPSRLQELLGKRAGTLCRGPHFLVRAYAATLNNRGLSTALVPDSRARAVKRMGLLHFGNSFVVAERFVSERAG